MIEILNVRLVRELHADLTLEYDVELVARILVIEDDVSCFEVLLDQSVLDFFHLVRVCKRFE